MNHLYLFQETSPSSATTVASSQPVSGSDPGVTPGVAGYRLDDYESVDVTASLVGATGGTLDVFLQVSPDQGATWVDAIHWPQLAAGAAAVVYRCTLARRPQVLSEAPVVVGTALTPALAVNTVVQGVGFSHARLVFKSGSGTSAGAKQVVWLAASRPRLREVGT